MHAATGRIDQLVQLTITRDPPLTKPFAFKMASKEFCDLAIVFVNQGPIN